MKERIVKCMQNIGCECDMSQDQPLAELLGDSIMFITFIVELEKEFSITIPDEYLILSNFQTIEDVCNILTNIEYVG